MKKDIFKTIVASIFLVLALIIVINLDNMKKNSREILRNEKNKKIARNYSSPEVQNNYNLPIVVINTNGNKLKRYSDINGEIQVYDNKSGLNKLTDIPKTVVKASFRIRGNSSSKYPKKQFTINILNKKENKKNLSLLGMPKGSEWILNAPFSDKSLIRNYITLNTSNKIMGYASKAKFCEVFIVDDNESELKSKNYQGIYLMTEKINRDEERVDITKTIDNMDETSFIVSKDRQKDGKIGIQTYGLETSIYNHGFNIRYPKKDLTPKKYQYIQKYLSEFERILYSEKFNDPIVGYNKYINVDSFVDFYIINEFFKNTDAGIYSTYFHKDYNSKMKAGPVWDFNQSLGNHTEGIGLPFEYEGFFMNQRPIFARLMEDKNFSEKVSKRYKELRKTYLSDEYLIQEINEASKKIGEAACRNFKKWPISLCNQAEVFEENNDVTGDYSIDKSKYEEFLKKNKHLLKSTKGKAKSYKEELGFMKNFIKNRGNWMDRNIESLSNWAN